MHTVSHTGHKRGSSNKSCRAPRLHLPIPRGPHAEHAGRCARPPDAGAADGAILRQHALRHAALQHCRERRQRARPLLFFAPVVCALVRRCRRRLYLPGGNAPRCVQRRGNGKEAARAGRQGCWCWQPQRARTQQLTRAACWQGGRASRLGPWSLLAVLLQAHAIQLECWQARRQALLRHRCCVLPCRCCSWLLHILQRTLACPGCFILLRILSPAGAAWGCCCSLRHVLRACCCWLWC